MKTRTKITLTLAVGMGLLISSMGTASASPHYTDWTGSGSLKAEVTNIDNTKVTHIKALGQTSGFSHHANVDKVQKKKNLSENIKVTIKDTIAPWINVSPVSVESAEFIPDGRNDGKITLDSDHDMNDITFGVSDIWTTGGTSSIWTSGGVTSIWKNVSSTQLFANFSPFIF